MKQWGFIIPHWCYMFLQKVNGTTQSTTLVFWSKYTLPWQWSLITISQENHWFHHTFPTDHCRLVSISSRKGRWRSSTYKGTPVVRRNSFTLLWRLCLKRMTFKMFFIQSSPPSQTLPCEVSYVYRSVWRWKWFSCLSNFVLQRFGLSERQILFSDVK